MIESLLNVLKKYQNEPLDGYLIIKIETKQLENTQFGVYSMFTKSGRKSFSIVDKLSENQAISIHLVKLPSDEKTKYTSPVYELYDAIETQIIKPQLHAYLLKSGDKNSIHLGDRPIIPAVLILETVLKHFPEISPFYCIKFYQPLYLNDNVLIGKYTDNQILGIFNKQILFKINF